MLVHIENLVKSYGDMLEMVDRGKGRGEGKQR